MQDYDLCKQCHTDVKMFDVNFEKIENTYLFRCLYGNSNKAKAPDSTKKPEKVADKIHITRKNGR